MKIINQSVVIFENEKELAEITKTKIIFEHDIYLVKTKNGEYKVFKSRLGKIN